VQKYRKKSYENRAKERGRVGDGEMGSEGNKII
jgi:hypothetical protein